MSLNYFGLVFIFFGALILFLRKYFLKASMESKSKYGQGMDGVVQLTMALNKFCNNPITFSDAQNQYIGVTKALIFLTGIGFVIVGLLVLFGLMMR